jgi:hypothetical protein
MRMTSSAARLLATTAVALAAAGGATGVSAGTGRHKVVVVADAALARTASAVAERRGAGLRLPRSPTEQLEVTHLFAARGYTIVGVGLVKRIAVDPVAARYPGVRFVLLPAEAAPRRVAACPPSC